MKFVVRCLSINLTCLMMLAGCATYDAQKVGPAPILQAQAEIPEEQLLDVGILVFESQELTEKQAKKEGTNPDIRKAESHYIPYHLKNTLQQSSHWGAVRVVPSETHSVDLMVNGEIIESNGEHLVLKIEVTDATGKLWLSKTYEEEASESIYSDNRPSEKDAFQGMYNTIANDIAALKLKLSANEIQKIRTTSKLRFANDFAPDAFGNYLKKDQNGILQLNRLPADNDPMMERLLKIREREYMYVDTLNEYYQIFYNEMWASYENWRKLNLAEQKAIRKIKRDAMIRQIVGALLLAGAVALEAGEVGNTGALQLGMVIMGGQVIIDGFNISEEAEIHAAVIEELSESFGNEMQPIVMDFQGKKYELTGSAEEQFKRWRELLRKIYLTETGFDLNLPAAGEAEEKPIGP
ncbi:MAG: hypothetical protein PVF79_07610 [Desulfobacterales bacterium]|jgi:hypothetical protein